MPMLKAPIAQDDHIIGQDGAAVTLVQYGDYECPYCEQLHQPLQALNQRFNNRLRYVFRHFPQNAVHPFSQLAAEAAELAAARGRFWEMHDALFASQSSFSIATITALLEKFGISGQELQTAIASRAHYDKVRLDTKGGLLSGVKGTPGFFINGERYTGALSAEGIEAAICEMMPREAAA